MADPVNGSPSLPSVSRDGQVLTKFVEHSLNLQKLQKADGQRHGEGAVEKRLSAFMRLYERGSRTRFDFRQVAARCERAFNVQQRIVRICVNEMDIISTWIRPWWNKNICIGKKKIYIHILTDIRIPTDPQVHSSVP